MSIFLPMKEMTVGEFKRDFSAALACVRQGEAVAVTYGRKKEIVAMFSPPSRGSTKSSRKLGRCAGRVRVKFRGKWEITEEEFLER